MSYDVCVLDPKTNEPMEFEEKHYYEGGTYVLGGTTEAHLNITYNYHPYFQSVWDHGLDEFHGKQAREVVPLLRDAVEKLGTRTTGNYWQPTAGNAGHALSNLLAILEAFPDGIVDIS